MENKDIYQCIDETLNKLNDSKLIDFAINKVPSELELLNVLIYCEKTLKQCYDELLKRDNEIMGLKNIVQGK